MSDYSVQVSWSGKDALADSNPQKVISGGDFNTEFSSVATHVGTKMDKASNLSDVTSASTSRTNLGLTIGTHVQAFDADNVVKDVVNTFSATQSGSITALTDASSIAVNLATNNHFSVTLAGNRALANPTNIVAGTSGSFFITQDGTGSRTLSYGSYYSFVGGTAPTLTTTAAGVDRVDYIARTTTDLHCVWSGDVK
tara:strand:+ start:3477 stop:4067 length:591 start_codon:yes stop_codon:yes gene_type:complete